MTLKGLKERWWFHSLVVSVQRQRYPAGEFSRGTGESTAMWALPICVEPESPEWRIFPSLTCELFCTVIDHVALMLFSNSCATHAGLFFFSVVELLKQ